MVGTDPDGYHYDVTGVPWVAYFNGGDAVHGYWRYGYGYPQSNGCVELPVDNAQVVWGHGPHRHARHGQRASEPAGPLARRRCSRLILCEPGSTYSPSHEPWPGGPARKGEAPEEKERQHHDHKDLRRGPGIAAAGRDRVGARLGHRRPGRGRLSRTRFGVTGYRRRSYAPPMRQP